MLVDGLTNQDVAAVLSMTIHTVKAHRAEVMRRMEAFTFADLVCKIRQLQPSPSHSDTRQSGPLHIVAVDDDPWYRDYLTENLAEHGFRTTGAANAGELDDACQHLRPDIVILDIELGPTEEDGISIANRLIENSRFGIIIVSAKGDESDRILGLSAGVDAYFTKPVSITELVLTIKNLGRRLHRN